MDLTARFCYMLYLKIEEMRSNMMTKSIKQRAKARVLFNRIEASNDTTMEVEMVLIPQLRKYLEVSRSEAWVSHAYD